MVPKHLGIILDGNRRFAKRLMLKPWKGHEYGAEKIEKLFDWCKELNIREVTLYTLSIPNLSRPKKELDYLMNLFREEFEKMKNEKKIHENKIRINFIGRLWMLPQDVQEKMKQLMEITKNYSNFIFNFAMAYDGRAEVIDAAKKIAEKLKQGKLNINEINEETFRKNLYMESEPDLIIRTGGEKRISGFLLWQGSYAEFFFTDKLWPEFEKQDLISAIKEYENRQRRFGK